MPSELKPCPFCGGNAGYCGGEEFEEYVWCENPHCKMHNRYEFTASYWNSRPIEDALRVENTQLQMLNTIQEKKITLLEAEIDRLQREDENAI